jgi:hypothetical protein
MQITVRAAVKLERVKIASNFHPNSSNPPTKYSFDLDLGSSSCLDLTLSNASVLGRVELSIPIGCRSNA